MTTSFDPAVRAKAVCDFLKQESEDVGVIGTPQDNTYVLTSPKVQ